MNTRKKICGTQESGYLSKQLLAAMQQEVLDDFGSDCGSKGYLEVTIREKDRQKIMYRYTIEGSKLGQITPENFSSYVGKTVKLRSVQFCLGDKMCNKCAGDMSYKLDNREIGLGTSKISNTLLRMGMKKFHTSNLSSKKIDVSDMII